MVGTAGRILDLLQRNTDTFSSVANVVIDDISLSNKEQLYNVVVALPHTARYIVVDSVFSEDNISYLPKFLRHPLVVPLSVENKTENGHIQMMQNLTHKWVEVHSKDEAISMLTNLLEPQTLVFCNTRAEVESVSEELMRLDFSVSTLHGDLEPKQRSAVLQEFRSGSSWFLITTPSFGIGIDIHQLSVVVNFSVPVSALHYIHQAGRAGRFGREGVALTFFNMQTQSEADRAVFRDIEKYVGNLNKHSLGTSGSSPSLT